MVFGGSTGTTRKGRIKSILDGEEPPRRRLSLLGDNDEDGDSRLPSFAGLGVATSSVIQNWTRTKTACVLLICVVITWICLVASPIVTAGKLHSRDIGSFGHQRYSSTNDGDSGRLDGIQPRQNRYESHPITCDSSIPRVRILQHTYTPPPPTPTFSRFIHTFTRIIFLGLPKWHEQELYEASVESHRYYAKVWGYGYTVERGNWLSEDSSRSKHLNKVYSLLTGVVAELEKGDKGAGWIM
jgi:hypothetical protein